MGISEDDKSLVQSLLQAFGGQPSVREYWDDNHVNSIDILSCIDSPHVGVTSYSTLGLSKHRIGFTSDNIPLGVEFIGAVGSTYSIFSNILATCAFCIINSKYKCYPGVIFRGVVKMYEGNSDMKHIMFVSPFLWENKLQTLEFSNRHVTYLLAVPISDSELAFAQTKSSDELETVFEQQQIDIFNLYRTSAL